MSINYVKQSKIDKVKWDKCINSSVNGIVYAYSWYLDIVSPNWDALIIGDYEAVMPITGKKKYGISYIYQPVYSQQLGVFTTGILNEKLVNDFLSAIPKFFKVINIKLNSYNKVSHKSFSIHEKVTYELDLISGYNTLRSHYSSNTVRNIKKAKNENIHIAKHTGLKDFLTLVNETSNIPVSIFELNCLRKIIPFAVRYNMGNIYGAYNSNNQLVAAAFIIKSHNKAIYHLAASTDEGKESRAMFSIIDSYIYDNAEKNLTLDFEGSMIEGIARFYKGFGAQPVKYLNIRRSRIPFFNISI